jgi:type I restriction enzyme S subunit
LDKAFAAIDQAKANLETNIANAKELFQSKLNAIFAKKGDGWVETTLTECLKAQPRNGWSPPAKNHSDSGTPVLTLSSVTGFVFKGSKVKYTSADVDRGRHYWVKNGDLLITRSNTPELVGHVAIANGIEYPTIYPDLIMRMKPTPDHAITEYLYYYLRSPRMREVIKGRAQGANPTMKKINKTAVLTLPVTLPALETQKDIVRKLKNISLKTDLTIKSYTQQLSALDELKKSILQKAFNGELTETTPFSTCTTDA